MGRPNEKISVMAESILELRTENLRLEEVLKRKEERLAKANVTALDRIAKMARMQDEVRNWKESFSWLKSAHWAKEQEVKDMTRTATICAGVAVLFFITTLVMTFLWAGAGL